MTPGTPVVAAAVVGVNVGIIVVLRVMVHSLATALSVAALVIGLVTALILAVVDLGVSLPSSVVVAVAGETAFLDQIGLLIVMRMTAMIVAVMDIVTLLTAETGMMGVVTVMPVTDTLLEVIALVQTGMELQIAISQAQDMVGSGREAMRETRCVAAVPMTGVAQGAVHMTGMSQGAVSEVPMTGMVRVGVLPTTAVEGLLAMMVEVTGRGLGHTIAPAGEEDAMRIASSESVRIKLCICTLMFSVWHG
jgi:hypothetical protein